MASRPVNVNVRIKKGVCVSNGFLFLQSQNENFILKEIVSRDEYYLKV
jgi:hypothetical protein